MNFARNGQQAGIRSWVAANLLPIGVVAASAVALSLGWGLFASRTRDRSSQGPTDEVSRIWGGPLRQPQPEVRWRRADAATVELAAGELARTDVAVDLQVQYRRRGVVEYPCYEAAVLGKYEFTNPSADAVFVAFTVGLPVERDALMLQDLRLQIDDAEDPPGTEYAPDRIVWTGRVAGGHTARFALRYLARGQSRFRYTFADPGGRQQQARPVSAFQLVMTVKGARGVLDYPLGSMSPTADRMDGANRVLAWKVDRLLSSFDVGVELPDARGVTAALVRLTTNAPFFYFLYAGTLLFALRRLARRARALHVAGLSATYFLYFPLATYLTAYLPWSAAAALALSGISTLAVVHAFRFAGLRASVLVALGHLFFLATPAAAYLIPQHTGLILVVAGFLVLASGLQVLGSFARDLRDDELQPAEAPAPVPERP